MEANSKQSGFLHRVKGFAIAAALGVAVEVLAAVVFACIGLKTGRLSGVANACLYVGSLSGGFAAGVTAARKAGRNGMLTGARAALICAVMTGLLALIPAGSSEAVWPVSAVAGIIGGLVGGLIGVNLSN